MEFRWWVTQHDHTVDVQIREGFVPAQFFEIVERVGSEQENPGDSLTLEELKADLTERLWHEPLHTLFQVTAGTNSPAQGRPACTN
jgi:hypothetical protein